MNQSIFMRVLFCKIHCPPFICFCKPSSAHLYTPGPLKLENSPHVDVPPTVVSVVDDTSDQISGETTEVKEESLLDGKQQESQKVLKSCIRKRPMELGGAPKEVEKKRVQWMDNLGKELVEVKEFESRCSCKDEESKDPLGSVGTQNRSFGKIAAVRLKTVLCRNSSFNDFTEYWSQSKVVEPKWYPYKEIVDTRVKNYLD